MIEDDVDWIFINITTEAITAKMETKEIKLIKDSWLPIRKDAKSAGLLLFKGLFTKFPEYLKLFPQFGALNLDQMRANTRLVRHATKVIDTVTFVVDSIGDEAKKDELNAALLAMVKSHLKRSIGLEAFRNLGIVLIDFICTINHRYQGNLNKLCKNKTSSAAVAVATFGVYNDNADDDDYTNYVDDVGSDADTFSADQVVITNANRADTNNTINNNSVTRINNNNTIVVGSKFDTNAMVAAWTKLYSNILDMVKSEEACLA